jgi:predicted Zn-ribbon and HTH transcriptional regulator
VEPRRSSKCGAKEEQQVWSQGGAASVEPRRSSKCGAKEEQQQVRKLRKSSKCRNAEIMERKVRQSMRSGALVSAEAQK